MRRNAGGVQVGGDLQGDGSTEAAPRVGNVTGVGGVLTSTASELQYSGSATIRVGNASSFTVLQTNGIPRFGSDANELVVYERFGVLPPGGGFGALSSFGAINFGRAGSDVTGIFSALTADGANPLSIAALDASNNLTLGDGSRVVRFINGATTTHEFNIGATKNLEIGSGYLGVGTGTVATSGVIRMASGQTLINVRNAGTDIPCIVASTNQFTFGHTVNGGALQVGSAISVALRVGANDRVKGDATGVGFNASAPIAKPALGAAATDLASVVTLANNIRTALINYGLCTA